VQPPTIIGRLRSLSPSQPPAIPEEKAAEQRAILVSLKTLKKAEDDANEALQQRILEDAVAHRALASAQRRERGEATAEKRRRDEGIDRAWLSSAPRDDK
jgi:ferritin-like protein